jgi:cytochrome c oxidase subunit 3
MSEAAHAHEIAPGTPLYQVIYDRCKLGMWLFLASEIMFFTGFIGSYVVLRMNNAEACLKDQHLIQGTLNLAVVNTVLLILSSLTMALAVHNARQSRQQLTSMYLLLTIMLGSGFLVIKAFEYMEKFGHDIYPSTSVFFSAYFTMTGFHGLHVLAGVFVLTGILAASVSGAYKGGHFRPVEMTGLYWHLVDLIWIFLFPILYLI